MTSEIYITGQACLTAYGLDLDDLGRHLGSQAALGAALPLGREEHPVCCAVLPDFKEALAPHASPLLRRKMSRLSKMAVTAAGQALTASGLVGPERRDCGVVLGTAFGSTAQSALFYGDLLAKGALKVNPGYFPETVPNAPAGQLSIIFGLQGANTTVCQQGLSSEHALALAFDLLAGGMASRMLVVGVEEMSPALLGGLQACGQLQNWSPACPAQITLGRRLRVGEAAVALVLETAESLAPRQNRALARLQGVVTAGAAAWPAVYPQIGPAVQRMIAGLDRHLCGRVGAVIAGATFLKEVDRGHLAALAAIFGPDMNVVLPEYGTGAVMGAGLLRTALAVTLVGGGQLPCRRLGAPVPSSLPYAELYSHRTAPVDQVLAATVCAGGGAGGVLVGRV
jgi:3-oxoacyl-[acyl-carrier-protein] synthase II